MRKIIVTIGLTLTLTGCPFATAPVRDIVAPQVRCNERAPAEAEPVRPSATASRERWIAWGRRWMGIATAEVTKRSNVADCLEEYRAKGIIR